jgi:hypothetical protein
VTTGQLSLFGKTPQPPPTCPHDRPTTHDHYEGLIQASAHDCFVCNHAALAHELRVQATHGGTRSDGKHPGMDFGHFPPTPADRARAHALLDELGVPPSGTPWSELVAWAAAKGRPRQGLTRDP